MAGDQAGQRERAGRTLYAFSAAAVASSTSVHDRPKKRKQEATKSQQDGLVAELDPH